MEFVGVAEELPNLIAETIFNHIRKGSDNKMMTVTGKLHIDLVQVILEVSLNHSLQVSAVDKENGQQENEPVQAQEMHVSPSPGEDQTRTKTETNRTDSSQNAPVLTLPSSTPEAPTENDGVESGKGEKSSHKPDENDHPQPSEESTEASMQSENIPTEDRSVRTPEKQSNTEKVGATKTPSTPEKSKTNFDPPSKLDFLKKSGLQKKQSSVNIEAKNKTIKSLLVSGVSGTDTKSKVSAAFKKQTSESAKSGKIAAKTSKIISQKTENQTKSAALDEEVVSRSGRRIVKPKRIWNPDMAASSLLTPKQVEADAESDDDDATMVMDLDNAGDSVSNENQDDDEPDLEELMAMESANEEEEEEKILVKKEKKKWKNFECTECDEAFRSRVRLKAHCSEVHAINMDSDVKVEPKIFKCTECDKEFHRKQNLAEHMFVHNKDTAYKCEACDKTFATQSKLTKHRKSALCKGAPPDPETTSRIDPESLAMIKDTSCVTCNRSLETYMYPLEGVTCPTCKLDYVSPPLEGAVVLTKEGEPEGSGELFKCGFCEETEFTADEDGLRNHMYEKHTDLLKHTCPFCEIKFVYQETLNLHMCQQHPNRFVKKNGEDIDTSKARWRKMYYCAACEKIFHTRIRLHDHIQVVHEMKQLPYQCTICQKRFMHRDVLVQHGKFSHANEWFRVCDVCGKFFRRKVEFDNHRHSDDPWKCEICHKTFVSYSGMKQHMKKHNEMPSLMCKFCGKMFHYQSFLTNHERLHTGATPFECDVCKRQFSNSYAFSKHKKRHTHKKLKCPHCPQLFMYPSDLKAHEKTHSSERLRFGCSLCECSYIKANSLQAHMKAKHNLDMESLDVVEIPLDQMQNLQNMQNMQNVQVAEQVSMEVVDMENARDITLYSCVTCNTCYYSEEECIQCHMSHSQVPQESQVHQVQEVSVPSMIIQ